jgi:tetratricopeptide (TPR) repeat protein
MHARFAQWVERRAGSPDEVAPILAHHYAEAVRPEDADLAWSGRDQELAELKANAVAWLGRAAELAIGRMEIDDALGLLRRALQLETDPGHLASLWRTVGRASILKFDGESFWTAMQESLALSTDPADAADLYAELAMQTATRRGMWMRRPATELIESWIRSALEVALPGSRERAKALIATAHLDHQGSRALAEEAAEIAQRIGDPDLQAWAWQALLWAVLARGDYEEAYAWSVRLVALAEEIGDPDLITMFYGNAAGTYPYIGRFKEAQELAARQVEVASRLSSHHRLHAASAVVFIAALAGDWGAVVGYSEKAESAFVDNMATPCILGSVMLLTCALGSVHEGNDPEAQRLETMVRDFGMEGYRQALDPVEIELATARGDVVTLDRKLRDFHPTELEDVEGLVAWLGALVALDRVTEIEESAPALAIPGSYLEPFALRALGYARRDDALIEQAAAGFTEMGLDWHASKTRELLSAWGKGIRGGLTIE